jgi:hypothetical protein
MSTKSIERIADDRRRRLGPNEIALVRQAVAAGERQVDIAARHGISQGWVSRLARKVHDVHNVTAPLSADMLDLDAELPPRLHQRLVSLLEFERRVRRILSPHVDSLWCPDGAARDPERALDEVELARARSYECAACGHPLAAHVPGDA